VEDLLELPERAVDPERVGGDVGDGVGEAVGLRPAVAVEVTVTQQQLLLLRATGVRVSTKSEFIFNADRIFYLFVV
jgi:hypothetical protein